MSKNVLKKLCGILSVVGVLTLNSTNVFAFSDVPATNIPDTVVNTKVDMHRSN